MLIPRCLVRSGRTQIHLGILTIGLVTAPIASFAQGGGSGGGSGGGYFGPWELYWVRTGQPLATYPDVAACTQATATQASGVLACKPALPPVSTPEAPPPAPNPPPVVTPPVMSGGLPVDGSALPMGSLGIPYEQVRATGEVAPLSDIGAFRTVCKFSHMAFDDPIVYPGRPGAAHLHAFFGNTGTNAHSTAQSIQNTGSSTCLGGTINRTAYWVPAMVDTSTGKAIPPDIAVFYYKQGYSLSPSQIQALPSGLRMVAGDPTASTPGSSASRFKCVGGPNRSNDQYGSAIPNCDAGAQVVQEIFFPQCWDGTNLDAPDHKGHMSYPVRSSMTGPACPARHPVAIPEIGFNIYYTVPSRGAARSWRLSSDVYDRNLPGGYSSHGDWFNGWKKDISDAWNAACVRARRDCHAHLLGDGRMMY
jgi:hypothetical protein